MADVKAATLKWLEQQQPTTPTTDDDLLFSVAQAEEEKIPQPEPYTLLLRMRSLNMPFYEAGGYGNQPYIQLLEFDACVDAETELENRKITNRRLQASYERYVQSQL